MYRVYWFLMTTPALAAQSRCDQWAGVEVSEFGVCLDTAMLGGSLCLITGECKFD